MPDKQFLNKISEEVIAVAAMKAALGVRGVNHLCDSFADNIIDKIVGKDIPTKGVKISREKENMTIDIFIVADYGTKIPQLAWDIQSAVKEKILQVTNKKVSAVNIHVQGVALPDRRNNE